MSNQTATKRSNEVMALERRIKRLEDIIRRIPSRMPVGVQTVPDGASIRETITQANSFTNGQVVYNNGGTWALAQANAAAGAAKYSGVVESSDGATFVVVYAGRIFHALTVGTTYYLSDTTPGLLVTRGTLTEFELNIPVLRSVSASTCIVMPARDNACDMTTLVAGDLASGGGELVINMTGDAFVTIDSTDGVIVGLGASVAEISIAMDGSVVITYPSKSSTITIDKDDIIGTGRDIRIREINVCDELGVAKKMLTIASDLYT